MANIRTWLERVEAFYEEPIEAIVVGKHYNDDAEPQPDENIIMPREAGLVKLDVEYDNGYGGADCFPMYAWTKSRVFFIHEYDGATGLNSVPRHPIDCKPDFGGDCSNA